MRALAITHKGIEDICAKEIAEITGIDEKHIKIEDNVVVFNVKGLKTICELCYKSQSSIKILFLFDVADVDDENLTETLNIIYGKIKKIDFSKWLDKERTFMVTCNRIGSHEFTSRDIEKGVGELIIKAIKKGQGYVQKVDLKDPNLIFSVFINNNKCYFGVDFCGFDMSKREYKIFNVSGSLKGNIAYALARLSDFKKNILNPLSRAGVTCIEAALFASNLPLNYYRKKNLVFVKLKPLKRFDFSKFFNNIDDKVKKKIEQKIYCYNNDIRNVQAARRNSKIAGVQDFVSFGKLDLEWLDTKFGKGQIHSIVAVVNFSKESNISDNKKFCNEFFYQSEFILNKKGKIVILSNNPDLVKDCAKKYGFKVFEERSIFSGKRELKVVVFSK